MKVGSHPSAETRASRLIIGRVRCSATLASPRALIVSVVVTYIARMAHMEEGKNGRKEAEKKQVERKKERRKRERIARFDRRT